MCAVLTSWETQNRYRIKNSLGQQVYFASEGELEELVDILCILRGNILWAQTYNIFQPPPLSQTKFLPTPLPESMSLLGIIIVTLSEVCHFILYVLFHS